MKMSELHAAFGLSGLDGVGEEIAARARIAEVYKSRLAPLDGIGVVTRGEGVRTKLVPFRHPRRRESRGHVPGRSVRQAWRAQHPLPQVFQSADDPHSALCRMFQIRRLPENPPNAHRFEREALRPPIYEDTSVDLAVAAALHSIVGSADNGI